MSKIREKVFITKSHKDKYNVKVCFPDKCLYDEVLSIAEIDKTISLSQILCKVSANTFITRFETGVKS